MQLIAVTGILLCLAATVWALRQLSLTGGVWSPGPFWKPLYFTIPLQILPALLALHVFPFGRETMFAGITPAEMNEASLWLIYGIAGFCIALVAADRTIGRFHFGNVRDSDIVVGTGIIVAVIGLLTIIYLKAGYLPIFHLGDANVGVLRKGVTTKAQFSPYYSSALTMLSFLGMAYAGLMVAGRKRALKITLVIVCSVGLLWNGAKGPVLHGILTLYFASLWSGGKNVNPARLLLVAGGGAIALAVIYSIIYVGLDSSALYERAFNRLFLGQMVGYYQAYSIATPDIHWAINWIPFSGVFVPDVQAFTRHLMVYMWGDTATNGYLTSVFLTQAWAALGYTGLIIAPWIVGFSMIASLHVLCSGLRRVAGQRFILACFFAFLDKNTIGASFAGFALMSNVIFPLVLFFSFSLACRVVLSAGRANPVRVVS